MATLAVTMSAPAIQVDLAGSQPIPSPEALSFGMPAPGWRRTLFIIIFESDTPSGKAFDVALLLMIVASAGCDSR